MKSLYPVVLLLFLTACPTTTNPYHADGDVAECRGDGECTAPDEPICGLDGQCRGCEGDGECVARDPNFPTCMGGACVATCVEGDEGDAQCSGWDPMRPYCVGETCVQCRDNGDCDGRICDTDAGLCRDCTEHAQCESGACGRDTGACVAAADIIYVDRNDPNASDLGRCDNAMPCLTITKAVDRIATQQDTRPIIVVRGDASVVYDGALTFDGITATLIGSGATIRPGLSEAGVLVTNAADVVMEGFTITGATGNQSGNGIYCNGVPGSEPAVRVQGVTITGNAATGINAYACTVSVSRSTLSSNARGGINLRDSAFVIANNFIMDNGDVVASTIGGAVIDNSGTSDVAERIFSFNTVFRNQANASADSKGVRCKSDNPTTATGNIIYGNVGDRNEISGTCTWSYSNIEGDIPAPNAGPGNISAAPLFKNANANDLHLQPDSPGVDVEGLTSDILIDFDGDDRPQNGLFDMGADEVLAQ
jgi:hypothetical protein